MAAGLAGACRLDFPDHDCADLFAVAVDIESYPRFIPWCRSAQIRQRDGDVLLVDNTFGAGPVEAQFQTRAAAMAPARLEITSDQPPFRRFRLVWSFAPLDGGGCRVSADYSIELRSILLHSLALVSLPEVERRLIHNFRDRVRTVYGGAAR